MTSVCVLLPECVGVCNSVRRALLANVKGWAAKDVVIVTNTSCVTDEYLAHRIGLLPVRRIGNGTTMRISRHGPTTVLAADLVGPAFEAVHPSIELVRLASGQAIDCTIQYDFDCGATHSRYAPVAAVGMQSHADGQVIRFDMTDEQDCSRRLLDQAFAHLDELVDDALRQLSRQPTVPPRSMC